MTTPLRAQAHNEFRQLLPWWGAIVGGIVAMAVWEAWARTTTLPISSSGQFLLVGSLIYSAGAVALGALTIGHEYTHHTLPTLLLQPIARTRVLVVKLAVLVVMLASLHGVAVLAIGLNFDQGFPRSTVLRWIPMACGLSLAPLLTMVFRGTLPGAVLSSALVIALFPVGAYFDVPYTEIDSIIVALTGLSAALMWWTFLHLEAAGGAQTEVDLLERFQRPAAATDAPLMPARRQRPMWLLVKKELRIQRPTFLVSTVFVLLWLLVTGARAGASGELPEATLYLGASLHVGLVALMAGALASAEERRFGTADWHLLLPVPAWIQWAVKSGIVASISVALTVGLPSLMMRLAPDSGLESAGIPPPGVILVVCLTALYVSSLSTNGVHALLATPVVIGAGMIFWGVVAWPITAAIRPAVLWLVGSLPRLVLAESTRYPDFLFDAAFWLGAGVSVLLVLFGFLNHSAADRSRRTVLRQVGWLVVYGTSVVLVLSLVGAVAFASIRTAG